MIYLALSEIAGRQSSQADSDHLVRMTCRQKRGGQTTLFEYIGYRAIVDLQNVFSVEFFSDHSRTEVGMLELVLGYFILVLLCEPSGMRLVSMRFIAEAFDIPSAFSESLEIVVDGALSTDLLDEIVNPDLRK